MHFDNVRNAKSPGEGFLLSATVVFFQALENHLLTVFWEKYNMAFCERRYSRFIQNVEFFYNLKNAGTKSEWKFLKEIHLEYYELSKIQVRKLSDVVIIIILNESIKIFLFYL